jgi:hypothetical protein
VDAAGRHGRQTRLHPARVRNKDSAGPDDILALAPAVHGIFSADPRYSALRWEWDGMPTDASPSAPAVI